MNALKICGLNVLCILGIAVAMAFFIIIVPPSFAWLTIKNRVALMRIRFREEFGHYSNDMEPLA